MGFSRVTGHEPVKIESPTGFRVSSVIIFSCVGAGHHNCDELESHKLTVDDINAFLTKYTKRTLMYIPRLTYNCENPELT